MLNPKHKKINSQAMLYQWIVIPHSIKSRRYTHNYLVVIMYDNIKAQILFMDFWI